MTTSVSNVSSGHFSDLIIDFSALDDDDSSWLSNNMFEALTIVDFCPCG